MKTDSDRSKLGQTRMVINWKEMKGVAESINLL